MGRPEPAPGAQTSRPVILLDTHVVLWREADSRLISAAAARAIAREETLLVSPLSFYEIGVLVTKQRIQLDRPLRRWTHDLLGDDLIELAPLSPGAASHAAALDPSFPGDPIDRLLYATALDLGVPMVSKDRRIREFAALARDVKVIW